MNALNRFALWLNKVMYGRRGADSLSFALLIAYCAVVLIARITSLYYLSLAAPLLLIWCLFRMLSRNLPARQRENDVFLRGWRRVSGWFRRAWSETSGFFRSLSNRFRDRKTYRYFRCPKCKKTLRVPKGKGKIAITCPLCGTEFIKKT